VLQLRLVRAGLIEKRSFSRHDREVEKRAIDRSVNHFLVKSVIRMDFNSFLQGRFRWLLGLMALLVPLTGAADEAAKKYFDQQVAPLLAQRCLECHNGFDLKGKLDLSSREGALRGGENGSAIHANQPLKGLLWDRVSKQEMPPEKPLLASEQKILEKWLQQGAHWGTSPINVFRFTTEKRAGYDWWALQPLKAVAVPEVKNKSRIRNPIDHFVLSRLESRGLGFAKDADPRQLVRRLYFDFLGLPPAPEVVAKFAADPSEAAYQQLLTEVLDSPHYGERWGRHWLDIARYGESDGFERNNPRKDLWPFRDWVIKAFNSDMGYDQFVRMQLAGDLIKGGDAEGLAASGFLVSAVHNTVVGGSEMMKRQSRADEVEELVGTIGQTFLGLTVNCARCHNHKFDPIAQEEYYQMAAAIAGFRHGTRDIERPDVKKESDLVRKQLKAVNEQLNLIRTRVRSEIIKQREVGETPAPQPPQPIARWEFETDLKDSIGAMHGSAQGNVKLEKGALVVHGNDFVITAPSNRRIEEKTLEAWIQLDDLDQRGGGAISIQTPSGVVFDAIVYGEREVKRWMAGSNGFVRTDSFHGAEESIAKDQPVHVAIVYTKDGMITGYRNGQLYGKPYKSVGLQSFDKTAVVSFGLRHLPAGGNKYLKGKILQAQLYDFALTPEAVAASAGDSKNYVSEAELVKGMSPDDRKAYQDLSAKQKRISDLLANLNKQGKYKIYTNVAKTPDVTYFLNRGDVMNRGKVISPGIVKAIQSLDFEMKLAADSSDRDRRLKLVEWITHPDNPLFKRVIVNRVWHYHFGSGIVDTPSDFGFNGSRPTHPELLDWLSQQLVAHRYQLKAIHRLIASSTTYRQAATFNRQAAGIDAENRLLWRKSPQRLEAEVVRDTMLSAAGVLNLKRGGPGFEDVKIVPNNGTTYYEPFDSDNVELNRRTIYRFSPRGGRAALLDVFDCPDPSAAAPRRSVTTTPLQALSLLNNAFVLRMTNHFANRVREESGEKNLDAQVKRSFQLCLGRPPTAEEQKLAKELISEHGLPALARALFNTNEFVIAQ